MSFSPLSLPLLLLSSLLFSVSFSISSSWSNTLFLLVSQPRSGSYLMVEMLNRSDLGLYCDGIQFEPDIPGTYGELYSRITSRLSESPKVSFPFLIESLHDFQRRHADVIAAGLKINADIPSPTHNLLQDIVASLPNIKMVLLLRDVLHGAMSMLEATKLDTWMVVNESAVGNYVPELSKKNIVDSETMEGWFDEPVKIDFQELKSAVQSRFAQKASYVSQHDWLIKHHFHSILVCSEDLMDPVTRPATLEKVYAYLLDISPGSKGYEDTMSVALGSVRKTKNQQGRSTRAIQERVTNWGQLCEDAMEFFKDPRHQDWEKYLQNQMTELCSSPSRTSSFAAYSPRDPAKFKSSRQRQPQKQH